MFLTDQFSTAYRLTVCHSLYTYGVKRLSLVIIALSLLASCGGGIVPTETQEPDPVVVDVPIAYIKRDLNIEGSGEVRQLFAPEQFLPGAVLVIKPRANASAEEVDISSTAFAEIVDDEGNPLPYDIKDLDSDYSGTKLIFAMRAPEQDGMDEEPTWNIWEYDTVTEILRRVIESDLVAERGQDTGPTYLADGRIVFSSTRQRGNQARLLDEGKPQYSGLEESRNNAASVLHLMDEDGSNIRQISFNQSHDFDPVVLPSGKILFSRWDQVNGSKGINLYKMNADGSDLEILYGRHSHDSVDGIGDFQYAATSITPDSRILAAINGFTVDRFSTDYVAIDTDNFIDNETPVASMASLTGPAQERALFDNIDLVGDISPGGYIAALYPLWDGSGRILFSWDQCRLLAPLPENAAPETERTIAPCNDENIADPGFTRAPSLYGLWMFSPATDATESTQLPLNVASEETVITEIVALESRPFPANPSTTVDSQETTLIEDKYGVLHIRSVYDIDGQDSSPSGLVNMANPLAVSPSQRPARFLRIVKSVSIPDDDTLDFSNRIFGRSQGQLFREILGYTPIQPDGSVKVAIPSGVPFAVSIVDANGKRISARHNNWLQLVPGEQKTCIGCHASNSTAPHGRTDAQPVSINTGALSTGVPFPNTNPDLFADAGETMAETYARVVGLPRLTADIIFEDVWADPDIQAPAESFTYAYADIGLSSDELPVTDACLREWTSICRAVINYPDHIEPIIQRSRVQEAIADEEPIDNTCVVCHSPMDANGEIRVPEGQLDLRPDQDVNRIDYSTSYVELMFNDNEQEVIEGSLIDRRVLVFDGNGDPVFEVDEEGELILDGEDNPIQVTRLVGISSSMRTNGARNSNRFFSVFEQGGTHAGILSPAEMRLIAEWLDIGGQYYNNPFDAPQD
ncbi:hypothetical protein [Glaciecola petra]|uniref:HzsA-related protein n=1 Tax=Glaciecola petra TaxID=3075602 RepID=UPI003D78883F